MIFLLDKRPTIINFNEFLCLYKFLIFFLDKEIILDLSTGL